MIKRNGGSGEVLLSNRNRQVGSKERASSLDSRLSAYDNAYAKAVPQPQCMSLSICKSSYPV